MENFGKDFEIAFGKACEKYKVEFYHFPNVGGRYVSADKICPEGILCDFIIKSGNKSILCEVKSYGARSLKFSRVDSFRKQVEDLSNFQNPYNGKKLVPLTACFVIFFRDSEKICVFDPYQLSVLQPYQFLTHKHANIIIGTSLDNMNPQLIFDGYAKPVLRPETFAGRSLYKYFNDYRRPRIA